MVDGALITTGLTIFFVSVALVFVGAIAYAVIRMRFPELFAPVDTDHTAVTSETRAPGQTAPLSDAEAAAQQGERTPDAAGRHERATQFA